MSKFLLTLSATIVLACCFLGFAPAAPKTSDNNKPVHPALTSSINQFSMSLMKAAPSISGNSLFSPYSLYNALLNLSTYAAGENRIQILSALNLNSNSDPQKGISVLNNSLSNVLFFAESIWVQQPSATSKQHPTAKHGVFYVNFDQSPQLATTLINQWVADKTKDLITHLLSESDITKATRVVLANAVYLKAKWLYPFTKSATIPLPFITSDNKTQKVATMQQHHYFPYTDNSTLQMAILPYQQQHLALAILLPKPGITTEQVLKGLSPQRFDQLIKKAKYTNLDLHLIRIKLDTRPADIAARLQAMGLQLPFTAQKYPLLNTDILLTVDKIAQQNMLSIDEAGTEAASATAIIMNKAMVMAPRPETKFYTDHPFVLILFDLKTHTILFIGQVQNPG